MIVTSLIQSHFDFACAVWYNGITQNLKNKLKTTENKLVRLVLNLEPISHIDFAHFTYV